VVPPAGSLPLLRWARGPLSVPYRPGTLAYKLQVKTRRRACIRTLPHALWLWTLPPYRGGLWRYHVPHDFGPRLPAREGSSAVTCHMALNPASLLRRAPVLPHAPWLRTLPTCSGELLCGHVSRDPQKVAGLKDKERLSWPTYAARLVCFQGAPTCLQDV
jgi:hypothetical protein